MVLPTNIDSSYADSGTDPSQAAHQQHHDEIHDAVNALNAAYDADVAAGFVGTKVAWLEQIGSGGAVDSVNGAVGAVVLDAGDIPFTPTGSISAATVQAAIAEAASESAGGASVSVSSFELVDDAAPQTVYAVPPMGVYDPATHRSYFAYLGLARDLFVTYYDHLSETVATPVAVGTYPQADDDNHGAPSLVIDLDGYIHVVWGAHNTAHQHSKSDSPRDISAWTTQSLHTGTYATILCHPTTGDLFIIDRSGSAHGSSFPAHEFAGISSSTDGGTTWGAATAIIDTDGSPEAASDAYVRAAAFDADGFINIVWTVARGAAHDGTRTDLHHAKYDPDTGILYTADNTALGTTIVWAEHASCVVLAGSPIPTAHLTLDGDRIIIASKLEIAGTYYAHVSIWDGSAWTNTDTGVSQPEFGTYQMVYVTDTGALRGLFPHRTGTYTDLNLYGSDGGDWYLIDTLLTGDTGEGYNRVAPIVGGDVGLVAIAQQEAATYASTSATAPDLLPLRVITDTAVSGERTVRHTHSEYAAADHTHEGGGASLGEWTTYTPAWTTSGTAPAIGNGTIRGLYKLVDDDLMELQIELVYGSTTTGGTSSWQFSLPTGYQTPAEGATGLVQMLPAHMRDASPSALYGGFARLAFGVTTMTVHLGTTWTNASASAPVTWATGDRLNIQGPLKVDASP